MMQVIQDGERQLPGLAGLRQFPGVVVGVTGVGEGLRLAWAVAEFAGDAERAPDSSNAAKTVRCLPRRTGTTTPPLRTRSGRSRRKSILDAIEPSPPAVRPRPHVLIEC
jgi:hypothetical protein